MAKGAALQPAPSEDLGQVDGFVGQQDRFDSQLAGQLLGGMVGAGVGAAGGTMLATVVSAASGLSGWSMIGAGVVGLVAGGGLGGYIGSR